MPSFNMIAEMPDATVVSSYVPTKRTVSAYESEAALENEFIKMLGEQGYVYAPIHEENALVENLKDKLEQLNDVKFSNSEWETFFNNCICNQNKSFVDRTRKIQEDYVQVLKRDDGISKNIKLIDKKNIHKNSLQVINQFEMATKQGAAHDNRYDVTILVNGLPLVHIELKRRGVPIKEAFNQIKRYERDSFSAGKGLYEYVQIYVISNGTDSKYFSNTTRESALKELERKGSSKKKTSNSFEFTCFWADAKNKAITDLVDFTKTFFAKHTLLNILTKYCILTAEDNLLVMRPYQITATERILNRIEIANNYKKYGTIEGGGYIWHTTGSGKTLTSFKTARMATELEYIDKVLFVIDRKDLDYQTMKEYDRFEKGAANSNTSTRILQRQLEDKSCKIIITTIQKLSCFIKKNPKHEVFNEHIVMIFDECHRSQFGDMHSLIVKKFKKYHLFGFTGTPIFPENSGAIKNVQFPTTEQTFGACLHSYTIINAINDKNVLPFKVEYCNTFKESENIKDEQVVDIDREGVLASPERISAITKYIIEHFDQKTYRKTSSYTRRLVVNTTDIASAKKQSSISPITQEIKTYGFNSMLCVSSVDMAKLYYTEFKKQLAQDPFNNLRVATIFSFAANEEEPDGFLGEENSEDTSSLDKTARDFLDDAICDYNKMFNTNYDTSSDKFQNYYKDVSLRMKNKEIDLLIVVNMFLTGFDATTLNTLWVDKNLKMHGLIQAFSRTNRILNSVKSYGNIVCFRNLTEKVDEALALFGNDEPHGIVLIKTFADYYNGYVDEDGKEHVGYVDLMQDLLQKFPLTEPQIMGESRKKEFLRLFGSILRLRNVLVTFDDFAGKELISERDLQDYLGKYQDTRDELIDKKSDSVDITDDVVFEIELVRQIEVNIDYILMLVEKYKEKHGDDKEIVVDIMKAVDSSPELRSKKDLIENFLAVVNDCDDVQQAWLEYIQEKRDKELETLIEQESLNSNMTHEFMKYSFNQGDIKTSGTDIDNLLPAMSRFGGDRSVKKQTVIEKFKAFFERYYGIGPTFEIK